MRIIDFFIDLITAGRGKKADIDVLRRILILNAMMIPGMGFTLFLGILAFRDGNTLLGAMDMLLCLVQAALILVSRRAKDLNRPINAAMTILLLFFVFLVVDGGEENTAVVWVLLFPAVSVALQGTRTGSIFSAVLALCVLLVFSEQDSGFVRGSYSDALQIRLSAVYLAIYFTAVIGEELRKRIHARMKRSMQEVKTLQGILPICLHCKKIRDDDGYWQAVDQYIHSRTEAQFSHALCPDCMKEHYSEFSESSENGEPAGPVPSSGSDGDHVDPRGD